MASRGATRDDRLFSVLRTAPWGLPSDYCDWPLLPDDWLATLSGNRGPALPLQAVPCLANRQDVLGLCGIVLELLARIEALLRRTTGTARASAAPSAERFGDVEVDRAARTVTRDGVPVYLAPMEFELLLALLQRRGAVVSRQELMREVWDHSAVVVSRTVDTHIAELRRKLEHDPAEPKHILTVRKAGYRLER